ncbi:MAG: diguanylate cyclase [Polyangiaceae bacterium]
MSRDDSDLNFLHGTLLTMLDASDEGYIVIDGNGQCRMIGRRAGEIFGIEPAACAGKSGAEVLQLFADACDEPDAFLRAAAPTIAAQALAVEIDVCRPLARTVMCRSITMARTFDGAPTPTDTEGDEASLGRIIFLRDVTLERAAEGSTRQLRARLRALMPFDSLTGLLNQRRLYEELGREHSRSTRAWDSYALLRVDVDAMKTINGEFGPPSGDQLLEKVARRLETCVREYDVLARLEGDEFGVLLPGADSVAARAVGERMRKAVSGEAFAFVVTSAGGTWATEDEGALRLPEPLLPMPSQRTVTVSVGGALWVPPSRQSAEAVFRRAGDALREARKLGNGQMHLYETA